MDAGNNSTAETELETMNGYQGTSLRSSPRTKTKDKERKPAQQSIDIVDGYPGKFLENITNNLGVDREPDLGLALTVWNCWASSMNKKPKCHRSDANLPAHIPYAGELSMLTSEQAETCLLLLLSRLRVGGSVALPIPSLVRIYNHLANFFMLSCANPATYTSLILRGLHIGKELQRQRGADGRTSDAEDATSVVGGAGVTPVTAEHENALWDSSVFSVDSAEGASYAAFFYMCKTFRLLDLQKHARLSPSDLITDEREDTDGKMRQCLRLTPSDGQR
ncbi:PREDICTED: uncharacterized protein LOC106813727 [Priapulus caudatus]|uniref:Uncharacterized protein LOC106813727 n=1 Tax=Priapulus caudatus TaxID=37621 RepID=A0ABM1EMK5_PRICU|nr:PREDICTED: uncharacterized protein LOC106813727 [Priapulus caudatus]